ncbi:transcriptional regulatory family protein, partial [Chlamydia psittaci 84-8471/1]
AFDYSLSLNRHN